MTDIYVILSPLEESSWSETDYCSFEIKQAEIEAYAQMLLENFKASAEPSSDDTGYTARLTKRIIDNL